MSRPRFQLVWYGWLPLSNWPRLFVERPCDGPLFRLVYRWRIAVGPLDLRRWR